LTRDTSHLIAGAGLSGLSLACALLDEGVREPITLVDRRTAFEADRTWCMWDVGQLRWSERARHRWATWSVRSDRRSSSGGSTRHPYLQLDATDVYRAALERLSRAPNVELTLGTRVIGFGEDDGGAWLETDRGTLRGDRVYDGLALSSPALGGLPRGGDIRLWQSFLGQVVETAEPVFDPSHCTLMDFRVPQDGEVRFVYVLPFDARRALIEHTSFGPCAVPHGLRREAIGTYLSEHLGVRDWRVEREERGRIPMTDAPFPLQRGPRTASIGLAGGAARPSSGYAFARTVVHADAVARSVAQGTAPPGHMGGRGLARLDRIFLAALSTRPDASPDYFGALLDRAPGDAFARFMNDVGTPLDVVRIALALPARPFAAAALRALMTPPRGHPTPAGALRR
jgi:lycopene beta-cyclase